MSKISFVVKRSGAIVPFLPERITNAIYRAAVAVGGRDRETAEQLGEQVVAILESTTPEGHNPTIEEIQDVVEKVLIENGHAKVAKAYILYRDERARLRQKRADKVAHPSQNIPWAKIWTALDRAVSLHLNTVEALNERIAQEEFPEIVAEGEKAYAEEVENVVEMIAQRKSELKIVIVAGPSSSGKTTTTTKIKLRLNRMGFHFSALNIDNYFYDLDVHPKDEFGDFDFETPQALELDLINTHIYHLLNGEEVMIPIYDFKSGHRLEASTPLLLGKGEVLLIDSLHGLYPAMTDRVPDEQKFKLYLEPLLQMKGMDGKYVRWTDLRLIRRMLRDEVYRAYDPRRTLEHWHYVRSSEMRHIVPQNHLADYIINTSMPYELPIYSARMRHQFSQWVNELRDNPLRQDAFTRAERVANLLQSITPVADESCIPPDSVLREFIGGSIYF